MSAEHFAGMTCTLSNDDPSEVPTGMNKLSKAIIHQCLDDLAGYDRFMLKDEKQRSQCHDTPGMKQNYVYTALSMIFPRSREKEEWADTVFTLAEYDQRRCQEYVLRKFPWVKEEL